MYAGRDLSNLLSRVNWAFPESSVHDRRPFELFDARQVHWYPATFIPEIPYTLIQALSEPGDSVLDPFAGLGTTLWQAEILGRRGYALELNAVAVRIMQSIWDAVAAPVPAQLLDSVRNAIEKSIGRIDEPPPENLRPWYTSGTWDELSEVRHAYNLLGSDPASQGLLFLATSSLLRVLSEQRRGWGCVADNMKPRTRDIEQAPYSRGAVTKILQRAGVISRQLEAFSSSLKSRGLDLEIPHSERIIQGDARGPATSVGALQLIVTSPPYPGMMDYATAQRLSYYWLGLDPEKALVDELGARRRRSRSNSLERYTAGISTALDSCVSQLNAGGYLCLVVPVFAAKSADPRHHAMDDILDGLRERELEKEWMGERNLPVGRRQLNQGWATLKSERIIVYRKRDGR